MYGGPDRRNALDDRRHNDNLICQYHAANSEAIAIHKGYWKSLYAFLSVFMIVLIGFSGWVATSTNAANTAIQTHLEVADRIVTNLESHIMELQECCGEITDSQHRQDLEIIELKGKH